MQEARKLMSRFEKYHRLVLPTQQETDTCLSLAPLFGTDRGKMFGVLECLDRDGCRRFLYGFSGQFQGYWQLEGWAPPLFDPGKFSTLTTRTEQRIKRLTSRISKLAESSEKRQKLRTRRRTLSRKLTAEIFRLYQLQNFRGRTASLEQAYSLPTNPPTGTGDCCAPRLLNHAARLGYRPIGISEFFWGRSNRSGTREHGRFYPPCKEKCEPILGFLLCGAEEHSQPVDHRYSTTPFTLV